MSRVRTALYLDFDNVFSGLLKLDPAAAIAFAETPGVWLERLRTSLTVEGERALLVRRCYMNPSGSVPNPGTPATRLHFSRFRPYFTRAGFDVIDCPSLTQGTKNAADIRMVLDAMEALNGLTHYDEFVLASGDSDLTPLLVRLRAADRRTTIVSPFDAAEAFTSIADRLIDGQQALELMQGEPDEDDSPASSDDPFVAELAMASLLRIDSATGGSDANDQPDAVARLAKLLDLPRLPSATWPSIYEVLAAFASTHEFNFSEATKWSRDKLAQRDSPVNRRSISFVVRGANYGGCPLYADPSPTAEQISSAFVNNVLARARAAEIDLSRDEETEVAAWLGGS